MKFLLNHSKEKFRNKKKKRTKRIKSTIAQYLGTEKFETNFNFAS